MPKQNPIGLWKDLQLTYNLMRDKQTPLLIKALPLLGVLYFLFPEGFAALPISLPLATPIDDMAVFYGLMRAMINLAPDHLVAKHRDGIEGDVVLDPDYSVKEEKWQA